MEFKNSYLTLSEKKFLGTKLNAREVYSDFLKAYHYEFFLKHDIQIVLTFDIFHLKWDYSLDVAGRKNWHSGEEGEFEDAQEVELEHNNIDSLK